MVKQDDISLVKLCLNGNCDAFEKLLDRYQKPIFNLVYRMCNNFDDAEDITQVVFIKVFNNLKSYNDKYKLYSWIYRIAINETLNHLKQRVRLEVLSDTYISKEETPDQIYNQLEISDTIQKALMELEPNYRIPITLKQLITPITNSPMAGIQTRCLTDSTALRVIFAGENLILAFLSEQIVSTSAPTSEAY